MTAGTDKTLGFVLNPIAGMGGSVGLKGTDGVVAQAIALGARPVAPGRALASLRALRALLARDPDAPRVRWLTCAGPMGEDVLRQAGFDAIALVDLLVPVETDSRATTAAVASFVERGADLIVFCGGDGTARDVTAVTGTATPVIGIPAGVKMFSGVFGVTPAGAAELVHRFVTGRIGLAPADVIDLDEARYREGELVLRLKAVATTPSEPSLTQAAKQFVTAASEEAQKAAIAADLRERIEAEPERLFLLGPGSTVASVAQALGVGKTLLGVDAVLAGERIGADLNERALLALLERHPRCTLVLSPIGAQGFVLGRGNQQLSSAVIRRIGAVNLVIVATPAKLALTPALRFDTGDPALDRTLTSRKFVAVIVGYRRRKAVRVAGAD